jgi:ComF family protein
MSQLLKQFIRQIGHMFKDLLFPPVCQNCHQVIEQPAAIVVVCPPCLRTLTPLPDEFARMHILNRLHPCFIDELWIAFEFNEVFRLLIHNIKYQKMPRLGKQVGELASGTFRAKLESLQGNPVLPIPLHLVRKKEREYNQSSYIARGIFENHLPVLTEDLLIRNRYTASQTRLNRMKRRQNVKDAFSLTDRDMLQNETVLLVDDVVTTGATMNECARLLKNNKVRRIIGVALATPVHEVWK